MKIVSLVTLPQDLVLREKQDPFARQHGLFSHLTRKTGHH
jgi:hypothetical protein